MTELFNLSPNNVEIVWFKVGVGVGAIDFQTVVYISVAAGDAEVKRTRFNSVAMMLKFFFMIGEIMGIQTRVVRGDVETATQDAEQGRTSRRGWYLMDTPL